MTTDHSRQSALVVGAGGLGLPIASRLVERGEHVYVTSRDAEKATSLAAALGPSAVGIALDLAQPASIAGALRDVGPVDHLVLTGISQYANTIAEFNVEEAVKAVITKLVGYPEVIHALGPRLTWESSVVLFGGMAKERPYPGSTMVTTFNQGISGLVRTLALELAPRRVNAIHPGLVGDSARWSGTQHPFAEHAPLHRLVTTEEITEAVLFLLDHTSVNGHDLVIDGAMSID